MSNELQTKLDAILLDKNTNLLPENLKAGVTCLGIEGTLTGGATTDTPIKLFETVDEMNNSTGNKERDLAVVYRSEIQNAVVDSKFSQATFPTTVVLPTAVTDYIDVTYRSTDDSVMFDCWGQFDSSMFMMNCYTETGEVYVQYESSDGITYTRTDGGEETIDFGTEIYYAYTDSWNDAIGYFVQIGGSTFEGLFNYNKDSKCISFIPVSSVSIDTNNDTCAVTGPASNKVYNIEILKNIIKNNHSDYSEYVYNFYMRNDELYCCRSSEAMLNNMYYIIDRYFYDGTTFTPCMRCASSSATLNEYKIDYNSQTITEYTTYTSATVHTSTVTTYAGFTMDTLSILYWPDSFGPEHDTNTTYFYPNSWSDIMSENVTNYSYGLTWLVAPTQLNTIADEVFNTIFYGKNGVETGTLQDTENLTLEQIKTRIEISSTIDDIILPEDSRYLFQNSKCSYLNIKHLDTSNVKDMYGLFSQCSELLELDLSNFVTTNVENIGALCYGCSNLSSVNLSSFDTSNVTDMSAIFYGYKGKTLDLSSFNTEKVVGMGSMFYHCTNLELLDISGFDFSSATEYSNIFGNIPADCEILVKDQTAKDWVLARRSDLTNVKIKS